MKRLAFLLLLIPWLTPAGCPQGMAAEVVITAPTTPVQPGMIAVLTVTGVDDVQWDQTEITCSQPAFTLPVTLRGNQKAVLFQGMTPGKYTLTLSLNGWRADLDAAVAKVTAARIDEALMTSLATSVAEIVTRYPLVSSAATLEVAGTVPPPPPPPPPTDAPWGSPGLSVLILRESQSLQSLPVAQRAIFTSAQVLQWLNSNCVQLPDGRPAFRVWDDDGSDVGNAPAVMQAAYKIVRAKMEDNAPTIGISNGKTGYIGPLPGTVVDMLKLLEAYK